MGHNTSIMMAEEAEKALLGLQTFDDAFKSGLEIFHTLSRVFRSAPTGLNPIRRNWIRKRNAKQNSEDRANFIGAVSNMLQEEKDRGAVKLFFVFDNTEEKGPGTHRIVIMWSSIFNDDANKFEVEWNDI
jgi:hypothetical protein